MKQYKIAATVLGQSVIHISPHTVQINPLETRQIASHLIGELKLLTDEKRVIHVRCPIRDGHIVVDNDATPDHKLGMQLYNTIVCKHPFGSRRVVLRKEETVHGKTKQHFEILNEDPKTLERRPEQPKRPAFNQQLAQQLHKVQDKQASPEPAVEETSQPESSEEAEVE